MNLDGPSGPGTPRVAPAGGDGAVRQLLAQGALEGRVTADLGPGGLRVATAFGILTVTEAALPFLPGDLVRLRLDVKNGRIKADPPGSAPTAAAPGAAAAEEALPPPVLSTPLGRNLALSSAVLAGLQPLLPGAGGHPGLAPPPGLSPESPAFAFLAALFPGAQPDRRPARPSRALRRQAWRAYHPDEEEDERPPPGAEDGPPPAGTDADPETAELDLTEIVDPAELLAVTWLDPAPGPGPDPGLDGEPTEDDPGSRAAVEFLLAGAGRLKIEAHLAPDRIRLSLSAAAPLPEALLDRIRARAETLARDWARPLEIVLEDGAAPPLDPTAPVPYPPEEDPLRPAQP